MTLGKIIQLLYVLAIVTAIVVGFIQTLILFRRNKGTKVKKTSTKEENVQLTEQVEKMDFFNTMRYKVMNYIGIAEKAYSGLKGVVGNYGDVKLENVLSKIRTDCAEQGVEYDEDSWKHYINSLIAFTNEINAKDTEKKETTSEFKDEKLG